MAVTTRKRAETVRPDRGLMRFLRETYEELRKVVWPTPQELYRYTVVVIATVAVISMFIGIVDGAVSTFVEKFVYTK